MKSLKMLLLFIAACFQLACNAQSLPSILITKSGKVEGTVENGIRAFKGIPFAAPPVGELRWKAPQPVTPWEGVLKADKFAPGSIQPQKLEQSEDCLYLNIWTTATSGKENLPVMVWIHGGGFSMGAPLEPTYYGQELTRKGVLFVSIAYRLGVLGFMAHPELSAESSHHVSGNYGLLDQIEALKWIRKNISAFGGDPDKVTIFGESAGAISVSMLCASPLAKGLFRGAISESGGSFGPVGNSRQDGIISLKGAETLGGEFMKRLGATSIAELRKVEPQELIKDPSARMGFWPNADGYVIPDDQYKLYAAGKYNDVNVIVGTNSDEGAIFARPSEPNDYKKRIQDRFGNFGVKMLEAFPGDTREQTTTSAADLFTFSAFAWPSWTWARLQSRTGKSNVYMYYFNQQQTRESYMQVTPRGAQHAAEIKYVLKTLDPKTAPADDLKLSELMATYWTNFAKTGDPNGGSLPVWPPFKEKNSSVLYLNGETKQGPVPGLDKLELMEQYFKYRREAK